MPLTLDCWSDELTETQKLAYEKANAEHLEIQTKLDEFVAETGVKSIYLGDMFSLYTMSGIPEKLSSISKPFSSDDYVSKERSVAVPKSTKKKKRDRHAPASPKAEDDFEDDDLMPLAKRIKNRRSERKQKHNKVTGDKRIEPAVESRPCESSSVGGLTIDLVSPSTQTAIASSISPMKSNAKTGIVDLTTDELQKVAADTRELTFSTLQGKTFPSLVVTARPSLKLKDVGTSVDRLGLDGQVKTVLMLTPSKFTEWLIQRGLVRSEQVCHIHANKSLKLGMYSDAKKFLYSGGYVWISECCPSRFVSVFYGSIFEGAQHMPSVLLKLIYHWSCQTNIQNVLQWVKIDNLTVKNLYTLLRSICTIALQNHPVTPFGGPLRHIEVGVISLGTTSQDGQQRQVKVEVLGVLDNEDKIVRLRAIEPIVDGVKNYKKRFSKILEPLEQWLLKDSIIVTDFSVDKGTLNAMGFKTVHQASTMNDQTGRNMTNANIMDYLRRIVPRMFQNTLSLLSRQIIQQFLDELVWREMYGPTAAQAFDNIVHHIAFQTKITASDTLVHRLNKVSGNPFKNWNFEKNTVDVSPGEQMKRRKRVQISDELAIILPKETKSVEPILKPSKASSSFAERRDKTAKSSSNSSPSSSSPLSTNIKSSHTSVVEKTSVFLEMYYYGVYEGDDNSSTNSQKLRRLFDPVQCGDCIEMLTTNTDLMEHVFRHAINETKATSTAVVQCRCCLAHFSSTETLERHLNYDHPLNTKQRWQSTLNCLICENRFPGNGMLAAHMAKNHHEHEMPYKCSICDYRSSSHRVTVDHFYSCHTGIGIVQCPKCLKAFNIAATLDNFHHFVDHINTHMVARNNICQKCNRCSLSFIGKGELRAHQLNDHVAGTEDTITTICKGVTNINKPKAKPIPPKSILNIRLVEKYDQLTFCVDEGRFCLECNSDMWEEYHFAGLFSCNKCAYHSGCVRAILEHSALCYPLSASSAAANSMPIINLDQEMHCICGYSSSEGNQLAHHLAVCDRKSAYPSVESVQENTAKRSMLDMLGLVRRDEDADVNPSEESSAGGNANEPPVG